MNSGAKKQILWFNTDILNEPFSKPFNFTDNL